MLRRHLVMLVHLVSRSLFPLQPLASHEACSWLWSRLARAFPDATDCTLMPNGVHLITDTETQERARKALADVLAGFSHRYGGTLWEPVPPPSEIPNRKHHRRNSRYLALNPSRDELVSDPLEWMFSTYRDVMGAVADPWVDAERLAAAHGVPAYGFRDAYHAYVSGDPTVAVAGTPPPVAAVPTEVSEHPLRRIQLAAAAATRRHPEAVRHRGLARDLFVALAREQGWMPRQIVRLCGISRRQIYRVELPSETLQAGRTCLADDRLLQATIDLAATPAVLDLRARTTRRVRRDRFVPRARVARRGAATAASQRRDGRT